MTKTEEMVLKTVHDLGVASALDVQDYMGLSATKATKALNSLTRKGYLKIAARRYQCDVNARDEDDVGITFVGNLWEFAPKGRRAAKKIPDIDEPMCIPINEKTIRKIRQIYTKGTRLGLKLMDDPQAPPIGTRDTVMGVDDSGRIMVNWDNGICLNVIASVDECRIVFKVVDA